MLATTALHTVPVCVSFTDWTFRTLGDALMRVDRPLITKDDGNGRPVFASAAARVITTALTSVQWSLNEAMLLNGFAEPPRPPRDEALLMDVLAHRVNIDKVSQSLLAAGEVRMRKKRRKRKETKTRMAERGEDRRKKSERRTKKKEEISK